MPVLLTCSVCGKEIRRPPSHAARTKTPVCSYQCNGVNRGREWATHGWKGARARKKKPDMRMEKNPAWKGGVTYKRPKGNYGQVRYVRAPIWALPMARKDGYVMEHRLVMATMLGRLLSRTEVVHHRDHDPLNNSATNLELWPSNGAHKMGEVGRIALGAANPLPV